MTRIAGSGAGLAHALRRWDGSALRWWFMCLAAAGLAACAPMPDGAFRDPSVPITASSRFSPDGFAGQWHVIAAYPSARFPGCANQRWQAATAQPDARLQVSCGGATALDTRVAVDARGVMQLGSGRLNTPDRALWVMWMAEDRRTAVIGTRGGEMGWIVNRSPRLRPDRETAARAIMAFNGYDIDALPKAAR